MFEDGKWHAAVEILNGLRRDALLVFAMVLSCATSARAQPLDNDYYTLRSSSPTASPEYIRNALGAVEKHHLTPALEHVRNGLHCRSLEDLNFILNYFPNHPRALLLKDDACKKCPKPAVCRMEETFARAVAVNREAAGTYVVQGISLAHSGKHSAAIESYKRALELEPASVNAHYNLGLSYFEMKRYEQANQHAQDAYQQGFALPGLRDKLKRSGHWNPNASGGATTFDQPGGSDGRNPAPSMSDSAVQSGANVKEQGK